MLNVNKFTVGDLGTNCFVIEDKSSGEVAIIDAGAYSKQLVNFIKNYDINKIKYVILTHGHFDHIGYAYPIAQTTQSKIIISKKDSKFTSDAMLNLSAMFGLPCDSFNASIEVQEGSIIELGETTLKVIETPGHTRGSICLISNDNKIFTGDTLMKDSMGRVDFPTGNSKDMDLSLKRLAELDGDYDLYCGHGANTTLDYERANNYYLKRVQGKIEYDDLY